MTNEAYTGPRCPKCGGQMYQRNKGETTDLWCCEKHRCGGLVVAMEPCSPNIRWSDGSFRWFNS